MMGEGDEYGFGIIESWKAYEFDSRKAHVLDGLMIGGRGIELEKKELNVKHDRSLKQEVDLKLVPLCELVNGLSDYYTLSCCSGRIVSFVSNENEDDISSSVKKMGYMNFVAHSRKEIDEDYYPIEKLIERLKCITPFYDSTSPIKNAGYNNKEENKICSMYNNNNNITLRFEPVLIHICCRTWISAQKLIQTTREAGIKDVGIMNFSRKGINIKICGSTRLAVPLKLNNHWLFQHNKDESISPLQLIINRCCHLMDINDQCIQRLQSLIQKNLNTS